MVTRYHYREPGDDTIPDPILLADNRVRRNTLSCTMNAEEGSVATSSFIIDDPDGDFDISGHRVFAVEETTAGTLDKFIYVGYTADRKYSRMPSGRVLTGRQIEVTTVDINTVLERRVMTGSDANRPAETDVARVQWLVATNEGHLVNTSRYLSTASPVAMDKVDYRGQMFKSVLDDCAQQSGKDYWLTFHGDNATVKYPWGTFELFYDFRSSTVYESTISLSNDSADVDSVTVFAIAAEVTSLRRDPSRVYSGVYMNYDGGSAYVQSAAIANAFARRDTTSPAENVKTNAKAEARAIRYLAEIDTEEDVISTSFQVPAASVNLLRQGMRVLIKATHLPGYESFQWLRVLNRTVKQDSELTYSIAVELGTSGGGEYSCTPNGYLVPTCTGALGDQIPTGAISFGSPTIGGGGGKGELTAEGVQLYGGASYHFRYTAVHATTNFECNLDLWMQGGTFGLANMGNFPPMPGPTPITEYEFDFTMPGGSDPCVYATIYEGAGYAGCNNIGSTGTLTVWYTSGPDPRFEGLAACP